MASWQPTPPTTRGSSAPQRPPASDPGEGIDSRYRVETPEQLGLEYDLAGLGTRGLAAAVDAIILSMSATIFFCIGIIAAAGVISAVPGLDDGVAGAIVLALIFLLTFAYVWGYYVFFETVWRGQTPGKQWLGLRVVREGGYQIGFAQAAIRNIVRLVDLLPGFYAVGAMVMLFEPRSRRLGDMVAGTLVIREPQSLTLEAIVSPGATGAGASAGASAPAPTLPPGEQLLPNLNRITPAESSLLGTYLQRRSSLAPAASEHLARTLAQGFAQRLGYTPAGDVPADFLARLARQHTVFQAQGPSATASNPYAAAYGAPASAYGVTPAAPPSAAPAPSTWTPPTLPTFIPTPPSTNNQPDTQDLQAPPDRQR